MDFKKVLILMYFNSAKDFYTYKDIIEILGISYMNLENYIEELIKDKYLDYTDGKYIRITDIAKEYLIKEGLYAINILNLLSNSDNITIDDCRKDKKIDFNDIYIPIDFDKKFKGYII